MHVMFDLETWGTTPGSDIRSIGAVVFDPVAGTLGDTFYVNVRNPMTLVRGHHPQEFDERPLYPLIRDPSTVQWWSEQSGAAQQRLTTDQVRLAEGLARFAEWLPTDDLALWSNGPHFDEAILAACYRATGQTVPWSHRAPRDCRTIWEAAGWPEIPFEGVEHDAVDDAKHQARKVIEAYRILGVRA